MKTIEYELDEAARALHELSRQIPSRSWAEPSHRRRSRLFVAVAATAIVLIAIGLPALFTRAEPPDTAGPGTMVDTTPTVDSAPRSLEEPSALPDPELDYALSLLPEDFDLGTASTVFSLQAEPREAALRYLEDRLPDLASIVRVESVKPAGAWLIARWSWETAEEEGVIGELILLEHDGVVDVLAATTNGVDLGELTFADGRLSGSITTTESIGGIGSDVLDRDGRPVAGSPYPEGFVPEADFVWGTAGYSEQGPLTLDVTPITEPFTVRVSLVGGMLLTISEVGFSPAS